MSLQYMLNLEDNQVALYLDILGFSEAIRNNKETTDCTKGITISLKDFQEAIFEHYPNEYQQSNQIKFIFVSDCFFITTAAENADQLIQEMIYLIKAMYDMDFALRGGISEGALYNGINIWGPAICNATNFEKVAQNPCVIIPKADFDKLSISKRYSHYFKETSREDFQELAKCTTPFLYFDFFSYYFETAMNDKENFIPFLSRSSSLIHEQFAHATDNSIKLKWRFLAKQLVPIIHQYAEYISFTREEAIQIGAEKRNKSPDEYLCMLQDAVSFTLEQ